MNDKKLAHTSVPNPTFFVLSAPFLGGNIQSNVNVRSHSGENEEHESPILIFGVLLLVENQVGNQ